MIFFGGYRQLTSSMQQTVNLDNIETSVKVSADQSVFQDLQDDDGEGVKMAFANAVV